jgi:hypothetical protein
MFKFIIIYTEDNQKSQELVGYAPEFFFGRQMKPN